MFHQQRSQSGYLAQRKNFFFPEISSPNCYLSLRPELGWLKTVGNVTGPSPQKALFPFSLYKLLLNANILCALTDNSKYIPSNAEHSCLIEVCIHPSLGQEASWSFGQSQIRSLILISILKLMALFQDQSIFPHRAHACHPNSISTLPT